MNSTPEVKTEFHVGEEKFFIVTSNPDDIIKIARYLLLINKYSEKNLKGNALDKTDQFCKYIEYGKKWYFNEELLEDIKEAIEVLWPNV